jgi:secreted trypsin-like serine protease
MTLNKILRCSFLALATVIPPTTVLAEREVTPIIANEKYPERGVLLEYQSAIEAHKTGEISKIIGGTDAPRLAQPWQVSLVIPWINDSRAAHFCGGSLIAHEWIVTAAHCIGNLQPGDVEVVAGTVILDKNNKRTPVLKIIVHPDFDPVTFNNDIALIRIAPITTFSNSLSPITLISENREGKLSHASSVRVTGWGATQVDGEAVARLQKIDISFISRKVCNAFISYDGSVTPLMLCAGTIPRIKNNTLIQDACQGDSGGPLVIDINKAEPMLGGIVSWGKGCAEPNKFGVYTRIPPQTEWIHRTIAHQ